MKTKIKKTVSLLMAAFISGSMFVSAGCGDAGDNGGDTIQPDAKNTFFTISCYDGGYGQEWLKTLCNELMLELQDVSFEPGKKGVYIDVGGDKSETQYTDIKGGSTSVDMYISAGGGPESYVGVKNGKIDFNDVIAYDVADILKEKVFDENGEVQLSEDKKSFAVSDDKSSLLDRMDEEIVETWNFGNAEGAPAEDIYYFMPFEDVPCGYVVDWDFMRELGLDNGSGIEGMPGTVEEFYNILESLEGYYSGWTIGSGVSHYIASFENAIRAKVDGIDKLKNMAYLLDDPEGYDFNGNGTIEEDEKIFFDNKNPSISNAYMATLTKGYEEVIKFSEKMNWSENGSTYYDSEAFVKQFREMQKDFVMSKNSAKRRRIAMLYEGEWWENETKAIFKQMGGANAEDGYGKRDFRMIPCPSFTENDAESKYLLTSKAVSLIVVNPNSVKRGSVKEQLAKMVIQYVFSRHGLATINTTTNVSMPSYKYEMTNDEINSLTKFGQWMYRLNHDYKEQYRYFRISSVERLIKNPALYARDLGIIYRGNCLSTLNTESRNGILYNKTTEQRVEYYFDQYKKTFSSLSN